MGGFDVGSLEVWLTGCRNVKSLVGEVDFSFHVISTADSSDESVLAKDGDKGKKD